MKLPNTQDTFEKELQSPSGQLSKPQVTVVTPHNKAIYEAGKKLLVDSIDVGREFCKFMITTCTSAIPIYVALLKLIDVEKLTNNPNSYSFLILVSTPCLLFLVAASLFMLGYFPSTGSFTLDIIEEIECARQQLIRRRKLIIIIASALFIFGMCGAIFTFVAVLF